MTEKLHLHYSLSGALLNSALTATVVQRQQHLLEQWKTDDAATYRSWFLWEERLKNFRSIRRGLHAVVKEIRDDTFGSAYRGSSLETVVHSIAEQRQIFKGADHAFLWKPKLRIPDIYENRNNQLAFARFLDTCLCCNAESEVVDAVRQLDAQQIKGLGPACANLLYFLHPTLVPPNNTAIVKGFNAFFGANVKLGRWSEYLAMRERILEFNATHRKYLSNDLGAVAGFLFDIGSGRYSIGSAGADAIDWKADLAKVHEETAAAHKARLAASENDQTHSQTQGWLRDLGLALGYRVWIANNDKGRAYGDGRLGDGCIGELPASIRASAAVDTIALIDVLWLDAVSGHIRMAFEVEHSTSIYSGIVRMLDLALGVPDHEGAAFFLVAPDARENDVRAQFARPAFSRVNELNVRYIGYSELAKHREAIARFGNGEKAILAISKSLAV
jgi:type II restriction enzyme